MYTKDLANSILNHNGISNDSGGFHNMHQSHLSNIINHVGGSIKSAGSLETGGSLAAIGAGSMMSPGGAFQGYSAFKPGEYPTHKQAEKMHRQALGETAEQREARLHQTGLPNFERDRMDVKQMYHHVLDLKPRHWELMREGASRVLGANPSPMWDHVKMKSHKPAAEPYHYQSILEMPNQHAAARTLEAEYSTGGDMGFYRALRDVYDKIKHVYQQLGDVTKSYNPKSPNAKTLQDVQKLRQMMQPLIASIMKMKGEANPGSIEDKIFEGILSTFTNKIPHSMKNNEEEPELEEAGGGFHAAVKKIRDTYHHIKNKVNEYMSKGIKAANITADVVGKVNPNYGDKVRSMAGKAQNLHQKSLDFQAKVSQLPGVRVQPGGSLLIGGGFHHGGGRQYY